MKKEGIKIEVMNRILLYIKVLFCLVVIDQNAFSQTANSTAGCAELKVEFTAAQAPSYFWKFGDGIASNSTLQNPVHSYVQPGTYTAQLFDQENGTQVGEDIIITVYPPIEIDINADVSAGCAPQEINFTSSIDIHPDINIKDIVWTFGDGNSASGQNTNYTYEENGTYTVSVKVITSDSIKCDEPVIFEDFIVLEGQNTNFFIDQYISCDMPAEFIFTNTTDAQSGTTYFWDFGDGQTSTGEGPHTITFTEEGVFYPVLTTTTPNGRESSKERTISIGSPLITPTFPDTICAGIETFLTQSTISNDFIWDFTGTSLDTSYSDLISTERWPKVIFSETGLQTFTLVAIAEDECESTVTLDVFVYKPDASYTLGPEESCVDPLFIEYTANDANLSLYTFNNNFKDGGEDITRSTPTGANIYVHPDYDPYHINTKDSLETRLVVTSSHGCFDTAFNYYYIQKPEAFFIPDIVKGKIPFEVNFFDRSFSDFDIVLRDWNFGDGQILSLGMNDTIVSHTYSTTGIHEAVLTITDAKGCVDISREVQILAIDSIDIPMLTGANCFSSGSGCPELDLCVGDALSILVNADQVTTNIHIESDDGRYNHCWRDNIGTHVYQYPGVYPINATWEFKTIYIDSLTTECSVTVVGSRSDIDYFINCNNPYEVSFDGVKSINANQYTWYLEDQVISNSMAFDYTFSERGEYTVYLETSQNGVDCTHRDSALIYITDIKANINIPAKSCVSSPNPLDASASQDVYNKCHAGYIWLFENQRPREVNDSILDHNFLPGFQTVTLIVEDINGCKDTTSAATTAYDLRASFTTDTLICLPSDLAMNDFSIGDTSIVSWNWNFGGSTSMEEHPIHEFDIMDYDTSYAGDTITIVLAIEDAIGCVDTTDFTIQTYDITSELFMNNGPIICENEAIIFSAADYDLGGSFLTYNWDFGSNGNSMEDHPAVTFSSAGDHLVNVTFTEDATGCQGSIDTLITVTPTPVANFTSNHDGEQFICFPEQLTFTNSSIVSDTTASYHWDFGNGAVSDIENPIIPFDKGTYEVQLIVSTLAGCRDTFAQIYTLVGPEGNFIVDKDNICPGDEITFTLESAIDVFSYTWDFGDGVQVDNQSPITHTYNSQSSVSTFTPTLILRSDDNGCELIQDIPINVSSITADFVATPGNCPGEISLVSDFVNPQAIEWNIDGQIINGVGNPTAIIDSEEPTIDIILNVTDVGGCAIERRQTLDNPDREMAVVQFPNVFSPNGDEINAMFNVVYDPDATESEVTIVEFKVYNRWGELLYNNEYPSRGWDGTYKGAIVPADIYAYYIEVSIDGCETRRRKGNVTVVK